MSLQLGSLKKSKVEKQKMNMGAEYQKKDLAQSSESFGLKQGKSISLPKGNPPINK